jgi:beta-glucanase (GH16 family)
VAKLRILTVSFAVAAVLAVASLSAAQQGPAGAASHGGQVLFSDNFRESTVDPARWNVRNNDWSSNELSIDTNRPVNVAIAGGRLLTTAQHETYTAYGTTRQYTSGYLDTIGRFSARPPLQVDARLRLPDSQGLWPALWLRGDNCLGEIDILETVGGKAQVVQSVHQSTNGDMAKLGYEWTPPPGWSKTDWHDYGFRWDPDGTMRWYIDGQLTLTRTTASVDNHGQPATWLTGPTFTCPFNLRLNLQVGGSMPNYYGLPVGPTSVFPAVMKVDQITVTRP